MNTATRLSSTPKTRASTSSGAILADQREPGDVDQRVADADERQQEQRRSLLREDADEGERQSPQADPDREPCAQSAGPDQERGAERPEHRAHPDRGHQGADAGIAGAEQLDRDHHREHGQRAAGQGLRCRESDDERQVAILRDRANALGRLSHAGWAARRAAARRGVVAEPQQQKRGRTNDAARRDREHDATRR